MTKKTFIIVIVVVLLGILAFVRIMDKRLLQEDNSAQNTPTQSGPSPSQPETNNTKGNYQNDRYGFSLDIPAGYTRNENYVYQNLGPGKDIPGVSFTIPASMSAGTNLSKDSYISVERLADAKPCTSNLFTATPSVTTQTYKDNGIIYTRDESQGAGAGNQYDEIIFALPDLPCTAIRYYIHTTSVANYPEGTVKEYDRASLLSAFDKIRQSLTLK